MYSGKPEIPEADDEHVVESEASGELGQNSQEHLSIEVKMTWHKSHQDYYTVLKVNVLNYFDVMSPAAQLMACE